MRYTVLFLGEGSLMSVFIPTSGLSIQTSFYKSHLPPVSSLHQNTLLPGKVIKKYSLEFTKGQQKLSSNRNMCLLHI